MSRAVAATWRWKHCRWVMAGLVLMSRISGLARSTIGRGIEDIRSGRCAPEGRVRKPGAGRKRKTEQDLTLLKDLKALVDPSTRGDPMGPLLWTTRSLRNLVKELSKLGRQGVSHGRRRAARSELCLQANSKTKEGGNTLIATRNSNTSTIRRSTS